MSEDISFQKLAFLVEELDTLLLREDLETDIRLKVIQSKEEINLQWHKLKAIDYLLSGDYDINSFNEYWRLNCHP
jgi:hypothetical protein